ncbi:MAG: DUF4399 domain-containing protein [Alphaproteobacteria bacterium GM202ARS2]|nr:DUF4399 domain-containing protein [Alphaproteobacteria bacterium GM202ARS2]
MTLFLLARRLVLVVLPVVLTVTLMPFYASAAEGRVYVISPEDGATVSSPFVVRFGLREWGIAPAGVDHPKTGHHHLLIQRGRNADVPLPPADEPIAYDDNHRHFGGGQTETTMNLQPGFYALRLVLGDANHYPIESMHSHIIRIRVTE